MNIRARIVAGETRTPRALANAEAAKETRKLLELLFRFVETRHKSQRLEAKLARRYLKDTLVAAHRCGADAHVMMAREHQKRGDLRKAIHAYRLAIAELDKVKDNSDIQQIQRKYHEQIAQLQETLSGTGKKPKVDDDGAPKLDKELDDMLKEEENWKKKADYE